MFKTENQYLKQTPKSNTTRVETKIHYFTAKRSWFSSISVIDSVAMLLTCMSLLCCSDLFSLRCVVFRGASLSNIIALTLTCWTPVGASYSHTAIHTVNLLASCFTIACTATVWSQNALTALHAHWLHTSFSQCTSDYQEAGRQH